MSGIQSIGWWVPEGRRSATEIARHYGIPEGAVARLGIKSHTVAGEGDQPSVMGARATRAALRAAGLQADDLDLLISVGVTRERLAPWVTAFGVLHELGASRATGFDLAGACTGMLDALWVAKTLVDAGTYRTVAVCAAERFDYLLGPPRPVVAALDVLYAAGASAAIVSAGADNDIVALSTLVNPDLSCHNAQGPIAGGSRHPFDEATLREGLQWWRRQISMRSVDGNAQHTLRAYTVNYQRLLEAAHVDTFDFVATAPVDPMRQYEMLESVGVDIRLIPATVPYLGHLGAADLLLVLGIALSINERRGHRIAFLNKSLTHANALAVVGRRDQLGINVAGDGLDLDLWRKPPDDLAGWRAWINGATPRAAEDRA